MSLKTSCWLSIFIYSYSSSHTIHLVITQLISFSMEGVFYEKTFSTWGCKNCKVSNEVHFCALHTTINVSKGKQFSLNVFIFIRKYLFAEEQRLRCWKLLLPAHTLTFNYSVFKRRPKDISKACLSLLTTKTQQDKPFWWLSIVTFNLPGFSGC